MMIKKSKKKFPTKDCLCMCSFFDAMRIQCWKLDLFFLLHLTIQYYDICRNTREKNMIRNRNLKALSFSSPNRNSSLVWYKIGNEISLAFNFCVFSLLIFAAIRKSDSSRFLWNETAMIVVIHSIQSVIVIDKMIF